MPMPVSSKESLNAMQCNHHNHIDANPVLLLLPGVIQDAKFKRREALADLAKAASKQ
jgi:hypothetical protein